MDVLNKLGDSEYEDEITQSVDTKMELILTGRCKERTVGYFRQTDKFLG